MKHLEEIGETYWEHFVNASSFAWTFAGLWFICLIHAIVPCWFTDTASKRVKELAKEMERELVVPGIKEDNT